MGLFANATFLLVGLGLALLVRHNPTAPPDRNSPFSKFLESVKPPENPRAVLRYFKVRGKAEPIRMLLELGGWEWREALHTGDEWRAGIKAQGTESGLYTFGQVPQLTVTYPDGSEVALVQTQTILRYLATQMGLHGSSAEESARIDMFADGTNDLRTKFSKIRWADDFEEKKPAFYENEVPPFLSFFSRVVPASGFISGTDHVTYADILLLDLIEVLESHAPRRESVLEGQNALKEWRKRVEQVPQIAAWFKSERRLPE